MTHRLLSPLPLMMSQQDQKSRSRGKTQGRLFTASVIMPWGPDQRTLTGTQQKATGQQQTVPSTRQIQTGSDENV